MDGIQKKLLGFISSQFVIDLEEIVLDKSLIDEGIIDSFGLVEIVTYIGREFQFEIREDQLNRDNFGSVLKIVDFIKRSTTHE